MKKLVCFMVLLLMGSTLAFSGCKERIEKPQAKEIPSSETETNFE